MRQSPYMAQRLECYYPNLCRKILLRNCSTKSDLQIQGDWAMLGKQAKQRIAPRGPEQTLSPQMHLTRHSLSLDHLEDTVPRQYLKKR